jgi:hypothetical protein
MTARPTLVFIRHTQIGDRAFSHNSELPPDVLTQEQIDKLIDQGVLKEYDRRDRRSLYRLFPAFSGVKEKEQLDNDELDEFALPK